MITTVCMNPAFDRTVTLPSLVPGATNRAQAVRVDLGGKGLNVSAALTRLGLESRCAAAVGEESLPAVEAMLRGRADEVRLLPVPGAVRTNLKLATPAGVTEVNEAGPALSPETAERLLADVLAACKGSRWAVLTGSLPPGCPADFYQRLITRLKAEGVRCVLDCAGEALRLGLLAGPALIKPNAEELSQLTGRPAGTPAEAARAARALIASGIPMAAVSLGGDGAVLACAEGVWYSPALRVPVSSTVGAGDCMVAGLLLGLSRGLASPDILRCGTAAGAAAVITDGTQLLRAPDFERLLPLAQAHRMESNAENAV